MVAEHLWGEFIYIVTIGSITAKRVPEKLQIQEVFQIKICVLAKMGEGFCRKLGKIHSIAVNGSFAWIDFEG